MDNLHGRFRSSVTLPRGVAGACLAARILAFAVSLIAAAGCSWESIEGRVVDVKGEPLPGVAVTCDPAGTQGVTNGRGQFRLRFQAGPVVLRFEKSGYTPGRMEGTIEKTRGLGETPDVVLWPLPSLPGVYLFEDLRYVQTRTAQAESFRTANIGVVRGTRTWPDIETMNPKPSIVSHNMPRFGVQLCRMALVEIPLEKAEAGTDRVEVWKRAQTIPVTPVPIDKPEGMLLQVRPEIDLEPGCYAVHWGALEGDRNAPDERLFLFSIGIPAGEAPSSGEPSPAKDEGTEPTPKPDESEPEPEAKSAAPVQDPPGPLPELSD